MDGMWPPNLSDLFALPKRSTQGERPKVRRSKTKAGRTATGEGGNPSSAFVPVVAEDGLFLRVLSPPLLPKPTPSQVDASRKRAADLAQTFRQALAEVWRMIPRSDRRELLTYWRTDSVPVPPDDPYPAVHRPVIFLMDGGPSSSCNRFGHELVFSTAFIEEHAHRLPAEITRVLAQVFRYATRAHWAMVESLLEEPMDRWERRRGIKATEAEYEAKRAALEKAFLRRHDCAMAQLLGRWGVPEARPEGRAAQRQ